MKNKILLYQPTISSHAFISPLALLAIGNSLLEENYEVEIVDANLNEQAHEAVLSQGLEVLFIGITAMVGAQIKDGVNLARKIRERFPGLPIVWGGWFPSVAYNQFLQEGAADYVVIGQGETTIKELADAIKTGGEKDRIPGIALKKDGKFIKTPDRPLTDLNQLPLPSYDLIDADVYIKKQEEIPHGQFRNTYRKVYGVEPSNCRTLFLSTSYGCPNNCSFCCSPEVCRRKWKGLSGENLAAAVERLQKKYDLGFIWFMDAEFFVDKKRVMTFCREILKRKVKIHWDPDGVCARDLAKLSEAELSLLKEAGCLSLFIGAEAAALETLKKLKKEHTPPEIVEEAVAKALEHKIIPRVSFLLGTPGESESSILETIDFSCKLKLRHPLSDIILLYFVPLPGTAFYEESLKLGFVPPASLAGWADKIYLKISVKHSIVSELREKHASMAKNIKHRFAPWASCDKEKLCLPEKILKKVCTFRLQHSLYRYPVDYWALKTVAKLYKRLLPSQ